MTTCNPATGAVTRLTFSGLPIPQGNSLRSLDVAPSASSLGQLFVYAINHRKPVQGPAKSVGTDSVVERFETTVGGVTLTHLKIVEGPMINIPTDIIGAVDGRISYFTTDHCGK